MPITAPTGAPQRNGLLHVIINKIYKTSFWKIFWLVGPILLFLFSLELLSTACRMLSKELIDSILRATSNPFIGLFIGLLATAIIQSSSSITSMTVAVVASGAIGLEHAIPVIIGANIGTTVTATVVAFNHIMRRKEFQRALSAATVNGFFNILTAVILLPLEYSTHFLSRLCLWVASFFVIENKLSRQNTSQWGIYYWAEQIAKYWQEYSLPLAVVAVLLLFAAIYWLVLVLKNLFMYNVGKNMEHIVFGTRYKALFWGIFSTALLQSSSLTTSFTVPLVANKKASLRQVFPFIMGANVGTTFTALFAALSNLDISLSIAFAHMLFNAIGVCIFFSMPIIKELPVVLAQMLGKLAMRYRLAGFMYLLLTFFAIPFFLIFFSEK
ncbi:MAG: Na/Pi symporter [Cytophagales bacterium]|nr:Na/Pi symporter [Bernardetiaceae bacterium]MDW8205739.1 Na/Pi symporter [Cytophagales bacterium]